MEKENKLKKREGISLIVLIIMVIIMLILISITIVQTQSSIDNADMTSFANILTQVQDAVQTYYISNNIYPTPTGKTDPIGRDTLLSLVDAKYVDLFTSELSLNYDDTTNTFYYVDLSKINVLKSTIGNGSNGTNDVFVVATPSLNVYYVKGISAKSQRFFSLSTDLTKQTNTAVIANSTDNSNTTALSYSGITITKYNGWTNTMPLTIKSTMASNEAMYISLSGGAEKQLNISIAGIYEKSFNLVELFSSNTILAAGQSFSTSEKNTFNNLAQTQKYLEVIKKSNGTEVGRNKVDLSKYEVEVPTVDSTLTINKYSNLNTITFSSSDARSELNQIRYDFMKKIGEDGIEVPYYSTMPNPSNFDLTYLKTKGKSLKISSDGKYGINVPKNISSVVILFLDNAGNWVRKEQAITNMFYPGVVVGSTSSSQVSLNINSYSTLGTNSIEVSYSTDAVSYSNAQTFSPASNNTLVTQAVTFTGISDSNIYVKVVVKDNVTPASNRYTYTRILPVKIQ